MLKHLVYMPAYLPFLRKVELINYMYKNFFKRIIDLIIAIISSPFFIMIYLPVAILIKAEDGGSVFYNAERIGKGKKPFRMYKFRSMKINAPDIRLTDGSTYNGKDDP